MLKEESQWKVSEKEVYESIVFEQYQHMGAKTVVCLLILNSGFEVVGTSAPVDPDTFDFAIGKTEAKKKAVDEVWKYLGSIVQNNMAIAKQRANMKEQQEELARQQAANTEKAEAETSEVMQPDTESKPAIESDSEGPDLKKV